LKADNSTMNLPLSALALDRHIGVFASGVKPVLVSFGRENINQYAGAKVILLINNFLGVMAWWRGPNIDPEPNITVVCRCVDR
jgi:hypothetical protein